jgi:hypothetical protein
MFQKKMTFDSPYSIFAGDTYYLYKDIIDALFNTDIQFQIVKQLVENIMNGMMIFDNIMNITRFIKLLLTDDTIDKSLINYQNKLVTTEDSRIKLPSISRDDLQIIQTRVDTIRKTHDFKEYVSIEKVLPVGKFNIEKCKDQSHVSILGDNYNYYIMDKDTRHITDIFYGCEIKDYGVDHICD